MMGAVMSRKCNIPPSLRPVLESSVQQKFDAYFRFTAGLCRAVPRNASYEYPNASLISDLTMVWSLFCELYELCRQGADGQEGAQNVGDCINGDPDVVMLMNGSVPGGLVTEFWAASNGSVQRVAAPDLASVLRTLRNGFAHFHWHYGKLTARQHWEAMGWSQSDAPNGFWDTVRPGNHDAYVADAPHFDPDKFWTQRGLRLLVSRYSALRHNLHQVLNIILHDDRTNVFDHARR
jgi:hypothetical protein